MAPPTPMMLVIAAVVSIVVVVIVFAVDMSGFLKILLLLPFAALAGFGLVGYLARRSPRLASSGVDLERGEAGRRGVALGAKAAAVASSAASHVHPGGGRGQVKNKQQSAGRSIGEVPHSVLQKIFGDDAERIKTAALDSPATVGSSSRSAERLESVSERFELGWPFGGEPPAQGARDSLRSTGDASNTKQPGYNETIKGADSLRLNREDEETGAIGQSSRRRKDSEGSKEDFLAMLGIRAGSTETTAGSEVGPDSRVDEGVAVGTLVEAEEEDDDPVEEEEREKQARRKSRRGATKSKPRTTKPGAGGTEPRRNVETTTEEAFIGDEKAMAKAIR